MSVFGPAAFALVDNLLSDIFRMPLAKLGRGRDKVSYLCCSRNRTMLARRAYRNREGVVRSASMSLACLALLGMAMLAPAQTAENSPANVHPLTKHALADWLTADLELRGRTEAQTAINYQSGNAQVYELTRIRGGLGVRVSRLVSAYAQFHDVHALGLPLSYTATNMRDSFDLRQGYVVFHTPPVTVFAGRQPLRLGEERLIGISNWTNVSRTFDVIHAELGNQKNRVDLFTGSVVKIFPTSFDRPTGGFYLHGVYATTTSIPKTVLELFVLLKTPPVKSLQGIAGREMLIAPGIRAAGQLAAGFDYDAQGTLERGSYVNDSIHAGAAYAKVGYAAQWLPWSLHLKAEYDYATGNPHRNPLRISTFDQFYPSNHNVFGLTDLFGWQNIKQRRLNLDLQPTKKLSLLFQGESLHAATAEDALYTGSGGKTVSPPAGGFRSDDIGTEFDASMRYTCGPHVTVQAGVGHLWPGALMNEAGNRPSLSVSYLQVTYLMDWWGKKRRRLPTP